jgi:hypothetical protein
LVIIVCADAEHVSNRIVVLTKKNGEICPLLLVNRLLNAAQFVIAVSLRTYRYG